MRIGGWWRFAVLASLALLVSGQLCMLTTCVPRLARSQSSAHHCCGSTGESPAAPAPLGAMPCSQLSSLAEATTLDAPLSCVAVVTTPEATALPVPVPVRTVQPRRDAGHGPGRTGPAPASLRAPPIV